MKLENFPEADRILKLIEDACEYFPVNLWDEIEFVGNVELHHDISILYDGRVYRSLVFKDLFSLLRKLKEKNVLLGITSDLVVRIYSFYDKIRKKFRTRLFPVSDYMGRGIGFVSLFDKRDDLPSKLIAHAFGHNRNLEHHQDPIDFMYEGLLHAYQSINTPFCEACVYKLKEENQGL
jgi:hypothetical protein